MAQYKDHPLAAVFPLMEPDEIKELSEDISRNGQRAPITLYENKILDGRNRYRACLKINREPRIRQYTGGEPQAFVISANLKRKHYKESQRAVIAAKLTGVQSNGCKPNSALMQSLSTAAAASQLNVSPRSVETAKAVIREGPKRIVSQVVAGTKKLVTAAKEIQRAKSQRDKTGCQIPDDILQDWREAEAFAESLKSLHRILLRLEDGIEKRELILREISNSVTIDLRNVWNELDRVLPYAVCPTCSGKNRKSCTLCKQRGFLSKFGYEHWVPKKTREIRENAAAISN